MAWLVPITFAVLAHTDLRAISADELATYRYTSDLVAYWQDDTPIAWVVQLGPRYFPDLAISLPAYALSQGEPRTWGAIFSLLNLALAYAALRVLLKAGAVDDHEASLAGLGFMASLLLLAAISFQGGANLLRTTYHNTLIAPALLFYALPMLGARIKSPRRLAASVFGFGALFGIVLHSNPLFLPWAVVPSLLAALAVSALGRVDWRAVVVVVGVTLVALAVAKAVGRGFEALPFVDYRGARLAGPIRLDHMGARLSGLGRSYGSYGTANVLLLYLLALAGGALSFRATVRAPDEARRFRVYVFLLFVTTALAVPAAMVITNLLSLRYLFWAIAVAALPIALGLADVAGRRHTRTAAGLAGLVLVTATPFFMLQARDAAHREKPEVAVMAALDAEAAAGRIGHTGLARYWIAHKVPLQSAFTIAPIGANARPSLLAGNAFLFWNWHSGCPRRRHFTFVITATNGPYRILPAAIEARFGAPAAIVPVSASGFEIWRYPDGIGAADKFYRELARRLRGRGLSTRALDRCGSPGH